MVYKLLFMPGKLAIITTFVTTEHLCWSLCRLCSSPLKVIKSNFNSLAALHMFYVPCNAKLQHNLSYDMLLFMQTAILQECLANVSCKSVLQKCHAK